MENQIHQAIDETSATRQHILGTRVVVAGIGYVYGKGVASTVVGSWVTFTTEWNTALLAASAVGMVGVAMSANVANQYGWYAGKGEVPAKGLTGLVAGKALYATGTAGSVDDAVVSGDLVAGAISVTALSGGLINAHLAYPFVTDTLS